MRRVDWLLAAMIGLFLAGWLAWRTLAWTAEVRLASREAVAAIATFTALRTSAVSPIAGQRPAPRTP